MWGAANLCSLAAAKNLGLAVAFPVSQGCIVVSGAIGLAVFGRGHSRGGAAGAAMGPGSSAAGGGWGGCGLVGAAGLVFGGAALLGRFSGVPPPLQPPA